MKKDTMESLRAQIKDLKAKDAASIEAIQYWSDLYRKADEHQKMTTAHNEKLLKDLGEANANHAKDVKFFSQEITSIRAAHAASAKAYQACLNALFAQFEYEGRKHTWTHPDGGKIEITTRFGDSDHAWALAK